MANENDAIDPAKLRARLKQIGDRQRVTNARLDALESRPTDHGVGLGLPFRVRPKRQREPYTQEQLAAKMIGNGATPEDADRWSKEILANNARGRA